MDQQEIKSILQEETTKDLQLVQNRIKGIKKVIDELEGLKIQNDNLSLENRYKKLKHEYFLEKNKELEGFILKYQDEIDFQAKILHDFPDPLSGKLNKLPPIFQGSIYSCIPYKLSLTCDTAYNPESTHELNYIFGKLPSSASGELRDYIKEVYDSKELDDRFYDFCEIYFDELIVDELMAEISKNFFLSKREILIKHVLHLYNKKDYISLSFILPSLIEGVFHDICETTGLKSIAFDKASLAESLKHIYSTIGYTYGFEYLLFEFPIKRNRIAHGRVNPSNYRGLAVHFLLDFSLAFNIASNPKIPLNNLLNIIEAPYFEAVLNLFNFEYDVLSEDIKKKYKTLGNFLIEPKFWSELRDHCIQRSSNIEMVRYFVKRLIGRNARFDQSESIKNRAIAFISRELPEIEEVNKIQRKQVEEFLEKLKKSPSV